jgi:hypothetical protein
MGFKAAAACAHKHAHEAIGGATCHAAAPNGNIAESVSGQHPTPWRSIRAGVRV